MRPRQSNAPDSWSISGINNRKSINNSNAVECFNLNDILFAKYPVTCFIVCESERKNRRRNWELRRQEEDVCVCQPRLYLFVFDLNYAAPSGNLGHTNSAPAWRRRYDTECLRAAAAAVIILAVMTWRNLGPWRGSRFMPPQEGTTSTWNVTTGGEWGEERRGRWRSEGDGGQNGGSGSMRRERRETRTRQEGKG